MEPSESAQASSRNGAALVRLDEVHLTLMNALEEMAPASQEESAAALLSSPGYSAPEGRIQLPIDTLWLPPKPYRRQWLVAAFIARRFMDGAFDIFPLGRVDPLPRSARRPSSDGRGWSDQINWETTIQEGRLTLLTLHPVNNELRRIVGLGPLGETASFYLPTRPEVFVKPLDEEGLISAWRGAIDATKASVRIDPALLRWAEDEMIRKAGGRHPSIREARKLAREIGLPIKGEPLGLWLNSWINRRPRGRPAGRN